VHIPGDTLLPVAAVAGVAAEEHIAAGVAAEEHIAVGVLQVVAVVAVAVLQVAVAVVLLYLQQSFRIYCKSLLHLQPGCRILNKT